MQQLVDRSSAWNDFLLFGSWFSIRCCINILGSSSPSADVPKSPTQNHTEENLPMENIGENDEDTIVTTESTCTKTTTASTTTLLPVTDSAFMVRIRSGS